MNKFVNIYRILTFKKNWQFNLSLLFVLSLLYSIVFINLQRIYCLSIIITYLLFSCIWGYILQTLNNVLNNNTLADWNINIIKYIQQSTNCYVACLINSSVLFLIFLFITFILKVGYYTLEYSNLKFLELTSQSISNFMDFGLFLITFAVIIPLTTINYAKKFNFKDSLNYKNILTDFIDKYKNYIIDIIFACLCYGFFQILFKIKYLNNHLILILLPFIYLIVDLSFAETFKKREGGKNVA